ncbi:MAG: EAL domain-containing protein [Chloroflexota bacterium]
MSIAPATPSPTSGAPNRRTPGSGLKRARRSAHSTSGQGLPTNLPLAAIEHAADAVIVVDLEGTILYVNAAFERSTGHHRGDVIGMNVHRLPAAEQPAASIEALWATLRRGEVWTGEFVHRRPDGTLAHTDARVAPIRDDAGAIVGAVSVSRDATRQRALETRLAEYLRERTSVAAALGAMHSGTTAEATAVAIGLALLGLSGFRSVGLFSLEPGGEVAPLAALDGAGRRIELPGSLPLERSAYLRERAGQGPWIEAWDPAPDHPYAGIGREQAAKVLAYVPVRSDGDVVGLLVVNAREDDALALAERLPALVECATLAGALLGPQLRSRATHSVRRARIEAIIADRGFLPVFQPIVELAMRTVVGYEALTRFTDGSRPDQIFAEAHRCGLPLELEAATLGAIFEAAGALPGAAWLNINVSPELVLAGEPLAALLAGTDRPVVLELTEHVAISDYPALRAALERLGPTVRLAVDDAGAGFASLRHILELGPDYVKLDRAIVRRVDRDPARQALVAGLVDFATRTGATLIAEGVETEAEVRQVERLGVPLAQGYRLGRPGLAASVAGPVPATTPSAAGAPSQAARRRQRPDRDDDIELAVNIGAALAASLRDVGVTTRAELRAIGALAAWERLRGRRHAIATGTTLLRLEGATRGVRITQMSAAERSRLQLMTRLVRRPG